MWKAAFTGRSETGSVSGRTSSGRKKSSGGASAVSSSSRKPEDEKRKSRSGSTYDDDERSSATYATAPTSRVGLTESAVRTLDRNDDNWEDEDKDTPSERRSVRSGDGRRHRRHRSEKERSGSRSRSRERRRSGRKESETSRGGKSKKSVDAGAERGIPEMGSFEQFPGQYAGGVMGNAGEQEPLMSGALEQGRPSSAPDNQFGHTRGDSYGQAADYYLDEGQSVSYQPGVRANSPNMLVNPDHHLMAATSEEHLAVDTGHGSAADFYDGRVSPVFTEEPQQIKHGKQPFLGSSRPSKPSASPSIGSTGAVTAAAVGGMSAAAALNGSRPSQSQNQKQKDTTRTTSSTSYHSVNASSSSPAKPQFRPERQNSAPVGPSSVGSTYYGPPPQNKYQEQNVNGNGNMSTPGKQPPHSNAVMYAAGAATAGAAGLAAYEMNQHHLHNQQSTSSQYGGTQQSARPPSSYSRAPGQPTAYMNGASGAGMDHYHYHEHKGPMTKLKDGLLNILSSEEDVVKMEMYTEYIGVCKNCFDPRSSAHDAPRRHHYHSSNRRDSFEELRRRRSLDRMRRAGSREQLGRTTAGSTRVDKDSRYYADAKRRSGSKTDLIGAGIAAAGVAAGASALMNHDRKDFDDTYSMKSGHRESSAMRRSSRSSSRERRKRSSYGVVGKDSKEEFAYVRTKDGRMEKRRVHRSRSRSRDRKTGLMGAAAGAALGASVVGAASSSSRNRRSRSRSRSYSPGHGFSDSKSRRSRRSPNGSYYDLSRTSGQQPQGSESGIFGGFFSPPAPKRRDPRREHRQKKAGFFSFGNGSSSSSDEGLAFGEGFASKTSLPLRRKSSTRHVRKKSDEHLAATVAGIGATAAALAAAQKGQRISRRTSRPELGARKLHVAHSSAASDDEWEDELPSDVDDASSNASGLAFGDYDRKLAKRQSMESVGSNRSSDDGLSAWGWRWGGKDKKRDRHRPSAQSSAYPPRPETLPMGNIGAGLAAGAVASAAMDAAGRPMRSESIASGMSQQPMQYVDPRPVSDAGSLSGSRHSAMPGAFDDGNFARPGPAPLQQPKPVAPINPSFTQSPPEMDLREAQGYRPPEPRRTQSSPSRSSFAQDAALIGAAAIGTAGIIASQGGRDRKGSKDVRFGLTDEQQAKEGREQRRQREKAADEERRRADRARALKEEAERHTREQDVLRQREAENRRRAEEELERQRAAQREMEEQAEMDRQRELERSKRRENAYREQEEARQRERWEREQREREIQAEIERKQRELDDQQQYELDQKTEERRQYEHREGEDSKRSASVPWGAVAAGAAAVVGGAAIYEHERHKDRDVRDGASRIEEIRPTEQQSSQPIMDDDIMDPDYFKRKRSDSDYRRHVELEHQAADKVIADQEAYYAQAPQSQADFFAPKDILARGAEGKERVGPKVDPVDEQVQVYYAPDDEIRKHFDREFYEVQHYGRSRHAPYGIPRLGLISPTPPPGVMSSGLKGSRSPSPLAQRKDSAEHVEDISAPVEVQNEPEPEPEIERKNNRRNRKGSRSRSISWGADQTHVYDVPTPDSHHEQDSYMENHDIPAAAAGTTAGIAAAAAAGAALHEVVSEPSSGEGAQKRMHREEDLVGKAKPTEDEDDLEEFRGDETPPIHRQKFYDSVSDVGFGGFSVDSPGTEGAPPVRGFVEGETDEPTPAAEKSPHIPGGFDDEEEEIAKPITSSESRDISALEAGRRENDGDYFDYAAEPTVSDFRSDVRPSEPEPEVEPAWEPPLTKKEKRKREKAAKRGSTLDDEIPVPKVTEREAPITRDVHEEPVQEPEPEPEWQPPLSKKEKKKLEKQTKKQGFGDVTEAMMTAGGIAAVAGAAVAADKDTESSDGKKSKKGKKKTRESERDIRDIEPAPTIAPAEASEQEHSGMPGSWDAEAQEKRAESPSEVVDSFQNQNYEDSSFRTPQVADSYAEFEEPKKSKSKKKRDSLRFNGPAASSPLRSEVAFDDYVGGNVAPSTAPAQGPAPSPSMNGYGQDYERAQRESAPSYFPATDAAVGIAVDDRGARNSEYEANDPPLPKISSRISPVNIRSVPSDPSGEQDNRHKSESERFRRESDYYDEPETYDDTKSVAASEPADAYASPRKSKRRSRHEDDDTASVVSSRSRRDTDESPSSTKKDKKGGLFGLFSRKSSDGVPLSRQSTRESKEAEDEDGERRHRIHRHRDSEYGDDDDARSVVSESKHGRHRSRSERDEDGEERHRSSRHGDHNDDREHHHHHRRRTDDSEYALSRTESEGSHRHHHHRRRTDEDANDRDQSFLGMRVEDMPPLPDSRPVSPDSAPVTQEQDHGIPVSAEQDNTHSASNDHADAFDLLRQSDGDQQQEVASADPRPPDGQKVSWEHADAFGLLRQDEGEQTSVDAGVSDPRGVIRDHADAFERLRQHDGEQQPGPASVHDAPSEDHLVSRDHADAFELMQQERPTEELDRSFSRALYNRPQPPLEDAVEYLPALPVSRPGSPGTFDELEKPQRPTSLQRTSTIAVPIRFPFGHQPLTPSPRMDRAASFGAPTSSLPASPSAQKIRQGRPTSTEIRPLYLVERNRKTPEVEEMLPSLPSSVPSSRASSLVGSEEYESAAEDASFPVRRRNLTIDTNHANEGPTDDYLDSQQTTPRATEFPQSPVGRPPRAQPQFYTWADLEQEARWQDNQGQEQGESVSQLADNDSSKLSQPTQSPLALNSEYSQHDDGLPVLPPSISEHLIDAHDDHAELSTGIVTAAAVVGSAAVLSHHTLNEHAQAQNPDEPVSVEHSNIAANRAGSANEDETMDQDDAKLVFQPSEDPHQAGDVPANMSTNDPPPLPYVSSEYSQNRLVSPDPGREEDRSDLPARPAQSSNNAVDDRLKLANGIAAAAAALGGLGGNAIAAHHTLNKHERLRASDPAAPPEAQYIASDFFHPGDDDSPRHLEEAAINDPSANSVSGTVEPPIESNVSEEPTSRDVDSFVNSERIMEEGSTSGILEQPKVYQQPRSNELDRFLQKEQDMEEGDIIDSGSYGREKDNDQSPGAYDPTLRDMHPLALSLTDLQMSEDASNRFVDRSPVQAQSQIPEAVTSDVATADDGRSSHSKDDVGSKETVAYFMQSEEQMEAGTASASDAHASSLIGNVVPPTGSDSRDIPTGDQSYGLQLEQPTAGAEASNPPGDDDEATPAPDLAPKLTRKSSKKEKRKQKAASKLAFEDGPIIEPTREEPAEETVEASQTDQYQNTSRKGIVTTPAPLTSGVVDIAEEPLQASYGDLSRDTHLEDELEPNKRAIERAEQMLVESGAVPPDPEDSWDTFPSVSRKKSKKNKKKQRALDPMLTSSEALSDELAGATSEDITAQAAPSEEIITHLPRGIANFVSTEPQDYDMVMDESSPMHAFLPENVPLPQDHDPELEPEPKPAPQLMSHPLNTAYRTDEDAVREASGMAIREPTQPGGLVVDDVNERLGQASTSQERVEHDHGDGSPAVEDAMDVDQVSVVPRSAFDVDTGYDKAVAIGDPSGTHVDTAADSANAERVDVSMPHAEAVPSLEDAIRKDDTQAASSLKADQTFTDAPDSTKPTALSDEPTQVEQDGSDFMPVSGDQEVRPEQQSQEEFTWTSSSKRKGKKGKKGKKSAFETPPNQPDVMEQSTLDSPSWKSEEPFAEIESFAMEEGAPVAVEQESTVPAPEEFWPPALSRKKSKKGKKSTPQISQVDEDPESIEQPKSVQMSQDALANEDADAHQTYYLPSDEQHFVAEPTTKIEDSNDLQKSDGFLLHEDEPASQEIAFGGNQAYSSESANESALFHEPTERELTQDDDLPVNATSMPIDENVLPEREVASTPVGVNDFLEAEDADYLWTPLPKQKKSKKNKRLEGVSIDDGGYTASNAAGGSKALEIQAPETIDAISTRNDIDPQPPAEEGGNDFWTASTKGKKGKKGKRAKRDSLETSAIGSPTRPQTSEEVIAPADDSIAIGEGPIAAVDHIEPASPYVKQPAYDEDGQQSALARVAEETSCEALPPLPASPPQEAALDEPHSEENMSRGNLFTDRNEPFVREPSALPQAHQSLTDTNMAEVPGEIHGSPAQPAESDVDDSLEQQGVDADTEIGDVDGDPGANEVDRSQAFPDAGVSKSVVRQDAPSVNLEPADLDDHPIQSMDDWQRELQPSYVRMKSKKDKKRAKKFGAPTADYWVDERAGQAEPGIPAESDETSLHTRHPLAEEATAAAGIGAVLGAEAVPGESREVDDVWSGFSTKRSKKGKGRAKKSGTSTPAVALEPERTQPVSEPMELSQDEDLAEAAPSVSADNVDPVITSSPRFREAMDVERAIPNTSPMPENKTHHHADFADYSAESMEMSVEPPSRTKDQALSNDPTPDATGAADAADDNFTLPAATNHDALKDRFHDPIHVALPEDDEDDWPERADVEDKQAFQRPVGHETSRNIGQETASTHAFNFENAVAATKPQHDIDFTATVAAGLADSGFDPNMVVNDRVFQRRATPPGAVGEADPGEVFASVKKKKKRMKEKKTTEVAAFDEDEKQSESSELPIEEQSQDDFNATLERSLAGSGFDTALLQQAATSSNDVSSGEVAEDPTEFSFSTPKRRMGKKLKQVQSSIASGIPKSDPINDDSELEANTRFGLDQPDELPMSDGGVSTTEQKPVPDAQPVGGIEPVQDVAHSTEQSSTDIRASEQDAKIARDSDMDVEDPAATLVVGGEREMDVDEMDKAYKAFKKNKRNKKKQKYAAFRAQSEPETPVPEADFAERSHKSSFTQDTTAAELEAEQMQSSANYVTEEEQGLPADVGFDVMQYDGAERARSIESPINEPEAIMPSSTSPRPQGYLYTSERSPSRSGSAMRDRATSSPAKTALDGDQTFEDPDQDVPEDQPPQHPGLIAIGAEAARTTATGIGAAPQRARSRNRDRTPDSTHHGSDRSLGLLPNDRHQSPSWSFENLEDESTPLLGSPLLGSKEHEVARDSGYQEANTPLLQRQSVESTRSPLPQIHTTQSRESLHSRRSAEPLRISTDTGPDWDLNVPKKRDSVEIDRQTDTLHTRTPSRETPLESTTKNRASYLFQTTPETLKEYSAPSDIPTPSQKSEASDYFRTRSRSIGREDDDAVGERSASIPERAAFSPPPTGTMSPLDTILEEHHAHKRTIGETDVKEPENIKAIRRTETPQAIRARERALSPRALPSVTIPPGSSRSVSNPLSTDELIHRLSWPAVDEDIGTVNIDRSLKRKLSRPVPSDVRSSSVMSNRSNASASQFRSPEELRSYSGISNRSSTPTLRRIDRSLSGDLRAASRRGEAGSAVGARSSPKTIPFEPPPTPPSNDDELMDAGASRSADMSDIYQGYGDAQAAQVSPTRPPNMRKRQSMHIMDLESRLDQLVAENQALHDAKQTRDGLALQADDSSQQMQEVLDARDLELREKDNEINQIRAMLQPIQEEVTRLTEINGGLTEANRNLVDDTNGRYATLQQEHVHAHEEWQSASRELDGMRQEHGRLTTGMREIVETEIATALADKNSEIRQLKEELDVATEKIRALQVQIQSTRSRDFLTVRDDDYFDGACQKLCQHVQQWVLRFSKLSDNHICRLYSDVNDEKVEARLDNAMVDGSDVDKLLGDRTRRRDVFMSVVMTIVWEYIFTRYLFGMEREQRQKLKQLEKILVEVGPPRAVAQWRATTLTLLSKRPAFAQQRELDTEAVTNEIFSLLCALLPPPSNSEQQLLSSLQKVIGIAVDLSIEMRTQRAEYIMLPPLQPEYDTSGDLVHKYHFKALLMNERSGMFSSNEELEESRAVVKIVLFPLVVRKGDESGEGEDEIVVCPAQVLVHNDNNKGKKIVRVQSGAMEIDDPRRSRQSLVSTTGGSMAF